MGATTSNPYEDKTKNAPIDQKDKPPPKATPQTIVPVRFMVGQQAGNPYNTSQLQASRYGGQSNPHF